MSAATRERATVALLLAVALALDLAMALGWVAVRGPVGWSVVVVALLSLPPCLVNAWRCVETVTAVRHGPPPPLPRRPVDDTIPAELKALVVYPLLISSRADVAAVVAAVRANRRASPHPNLGHLVVADCPDSVTRDEPGEVRWHRELLRALAGLDAERSGRGAVGVVVRRRTWNPVTRRWMGWERKRGNVLDLCAAVVAGAGARYHRDPRANALLVGVRFLMVLDVGTELHPRTVRELLGVLAAEADANPATVIAQPSYRVRPPNRPNRFQRLLYAGVAAPGPGPAPTQFSLLQHVTGQELFGGQALIHVRPFLSALRAAVPENTVLSHDKLEANYVRSRWVSDAVILGAPVRSYLQLRRRLERWARGDLQLLPWIVGQHRPPGGLRPLFRLAMVRDVAAPVADVCAVGLLAIAWALTGGLTAVGVSIAVLALTGGAVLPAFAGVAADVAYRRRPAWSALLAAGRGEAERLLLLADRATYTAGAVSRAVWRMTFARHRLLDWQPSAVAARALAAQRLPWIRQMWPGVLLGVSGTFVLMYDGAAMASVPIVGLWMVAPAVMWWLSSPASSILQRPGATTTVDNDGITGRTSTGADHLHHGRIATRFPAAFTMDRDGGASHREPRSTTP